MAEGGAERPIMIVDTPPPPGAPEESAPPPRPMPQPLIKEITDLLQSIYPNLPPQRYEEGLKFAEQNLDPAMRQTIEAYVDVATAFFSKLPELKAMEPPPPNPNSVVQTPEFVAKSVKEIYSNVDPDWIDSKAYKDKWSVERIIDFMTDPNHNIPKKMTKRKAAAQAEAEASGGKARKEFTLLDRWTDIDFPGPDYTYAEALNVLCQDFYWVRKVDLQKVLNIYKGTFAPAFVALKEAEQRAIEKKLIVAGAGGKQGVGGKLDVEIPDRAHSNLHVGQRRVRSINLLKIYRSRLNQQPTSESLKRERDFAIQKTTGSEEAGAAVPENVQGSAEEVASGETLECGVCFNDVLVLKAIGCQESHFFCEECVQAQGKEAVFGLGKSEIICLATECGARFTRADLEKVLDAKVLEKLDEKLAETELEQAGLQGLERCKYCSWAMVMEVSPEENKVFECQNCEAEVCRICGLDWDDSHKGVPCKDMESDTAAKARKEYESKLTEAIIRRCPRCKNPIIKSEGCNKMTCQCGGKLCYLCRAPHIDYDHFCRHLIEPPNKKCTKCTKCLLWDTGKEQDKKKVEEIEAAAKQDERMYVRNISSPQPTATTSHGQDEPGTSSGSTNGPRTYNDIFRAHGSTTTPAPWYNFHNYTGQPMEQPPPLIPTTSTSTVMANPVTAPWLWGPSGSVANAAPGPYADPLVPFLNPPPVDPTRYHPNYPETLPVFMNPAVPPNPTQQPWMPPYAANSGPANNFFADPGPIDPLPDLGAQVELELPNRQQLPPNNAAFGGF